MGSSGSELETPTTLRQRASGSEAENAHPWQDTRVQAWEHHQRLPRPLNDPLLAAILITAAVLSIGLGALAITWGAGPVIAELPLYVPTISSFAALAAASVAFLAFGRYRVLREPSAFWAGAAFGALAVLYVLYVLTWPGLGPDGRALVGNLPNTPAWIYHLAAAITGVLLLTAAISPWPGPNVRPVPLGLVLVWLAVVALVGALAVVFEASLPELVVGGRFTVATRVVTVALFAGYGGGTILSTWRYRRAGNTLVGYLALFQTAITLSLVAFAMSRQRYDLWWYVSRLLVAGAVTSVLFGLLSEYVALYRRERERTRALEQQGALLRAVLDQMPAGVVIAEAPSGRVLEVNDRMAQFFGQTTLPANVLVDHPERQGWHPDGRRYTAEEWPLARTILHGEIVRDEEIVIPHDDGTRQVVSANSAPVRDSAGDVVAAVVVDVDVTERNAFEEALRESEERLRALVTASSEVLYRMSPDWSEMRQLHSRGFLADTERPSRTWIHEYIHPDDQPHVNAAIQRAIQTKSVFELEHRVRRADGSLGWTLSRAVPLMDAHGEIVEWFGAASDITERKQAEEALRRAADRDAYLVRLADALRPLADPVEVQSAAARVLGEHLGANRVHYAEIVGDQAVIAREYVAGAASMNGRHRISDCRGAILSAYRAGRSYVSDDIANNGMSAAEQAALASAGIRACAGIPLVKNGTWVAVIEVHSTTPRAWQPQELALITETAERTWAAVEQARAEEALRASETRFRRVLENSRDAIYRSNLRTGGYDYLSPSVEALTGYTEQELASMPTAWMYERVHPEDRERLQSGVELLGQRPAGERSGVVEFRWLHRSGEYRWISNSRSLITDAENRPVALVGTLRDVTERKEIERQLRELNETLEARVAERTGELRALAAELTTAEERARRRIARVLHDDLQQILAAALYHLEHTRAQASIAEGDRCLQEPISMLREALQTSRALTAELSPTILYELGLVPALQWLARHMQERHGLWVVVEAEEPSDAPPIPEDAKLLLYQTARELLYNVVKHARVAQATLRLAYPSRDAVEMAVADTGAGFDPARLGEQRHAGGAYGLFFLSERLEYAGGRLRIESAPGEGTRVTVSVPLAPQRDRSE